MNRMMAMLLCAFLLASCALYQGSRNIPVATKFDERDFEWSAEPGNASITGQAFMKSDEGDIKTCAGNEVWLMPANNYNHEVIRIISSGNQAVGDLRVNDYNRTAVCDAQGDFAFNGLPAGLWILNASIYWKEREWPYPYSSSPYYSGHYYSSPYGPDFRVVGGFLVRDVQTSAGRTSQVLLTPDHKVY